MKRFAPVVIALLLAVSGGGSAAAGDPRIRTMTYTPDRVISLIGHFGYLITIELPPGERVENVALGDSLSWQVTPNKRGDMLFVKPVDEGPPTNLTITTGDRQYSFELTARRRTPETPPSEMTYLLRLRLPDAAPLAAADAEDVSPRPSSLLDRPITNERYTYDGAKENLPSRVYDDGVSTFFVWPQGAATPAIFAPGPDRKDSVVNYSYAGEKIVVHQVAERFTLRNGKLVTTIYNDGYHPPDPGPDAPAPREQRHRGFLGLGG